MVAIKDMEMPKYCNDCDFVVDSMGYCERANEQIPNYDFYSETNERPNFCPLVEIEERKVGKWIRKPIRNDKGGCIGAEMICFCCNKDNRHDEYMDFCPNCGADMRGVENG